jgi:hypothetical protein
MLAWRLALVGIFALASALGLWRVNRAGTLGRGALGAGLGVWAVGVGSAIAMAPERTAATVESLIYLALLLVLLRCTPLVASIRAAPRAVRWGVALAGATAIHVQVRNVGTPYPLAPWAMFGDGGDFDTLSFYEYAGIHRNGTEERLALANILPSLKADRIRIAVDELAAQATRTDAATPPADVVARFNTMLQTLSRVYNMDHPEDPIESLVVYLSRVDIPPGRPPGLPSTRKVWSVKVE